MSNAASTDYCCPNCGVALAADATKCTSCAALFGGAASWKPLPAAQLSRKPRSGRRFILLGLGIGVSCPLAFLLGIGFEKLLPNCQVGAVGPTTGCILFGQEINGLVGILINLGFVGAVVLTPIGALLFVSGLVASARRRSLTK